MLIVKVFLRKALGFLLTIGALVTPFFFNPFKLNCYPAARLQTSLHCQVGMGTGAEPHREAGGENSAVLL